VAVVAVVPPQKIVEADEDESTPLVPSEQTEE
jgi:hypothetical protein